MAKRTNLRERVSFRNKWAVKRFKLARPKESVCVYKWVCVRVWVSVCGILLPLYCGRLAAWPSLSRVKRHKRVNDLEVAFNALRSARHLFLVVCCVGVCVWFAVASLPLKCWLLSRSHWVRFVLVSCPSFFYQFYAVFCCCLLRPQYDYFFMANF